MSHNVLALCAGKPQPFRGEEESAIAKNMIGGTVRITKEGLEGDEQADKAVHGGPDMALHQYPVDHHNFWREHLGKHQLLDQAGAFGSNISVRGLTEGAVRLGDRFQLGTAIIETSQPRQPCWKIEHRFGRKGMLKQILKTGRCGWYYRVIEEGEAKAGDKLELVGHGLSNWTIARIFEAIWGTNSPPDLELIREISELDLLSKRLRKKLKTKLEQL